MPIKRSILYFLIFLLLAGIGWIFVGPQIEGYVTSSLRRLEILQKGDLGENMEEAETSVSTPPPLKSEKDAPSSVLTQAGTIKWTNINRAQNGLPNLKENPKLNEAAMKKAQDILKLQYFDHISPTGVGPQDLAERVGYEYISIGENLAMGNFANDKELLEAWMASPGHRENILSKGFTEIGVAVLRGEYQGKKTWVAVQEFGTPLSQCPRVSSEKKKIIEANTKKIKSLFRELDSERDEIESLRPRDPGYAEAVEKYNDKVKEYNSLVSQTRSLIKEYNSEVTAFNRCIKRFSQ